MTIVIISILTITSMAWLVKKRFKFEICPICVGVALTWIWMLVAMNLSKLSIINYQLLTALLMGGTVVGLMSKLEQFIKTKFVLIWKIIFVLSGFITAYNLIFSNWVIFAVGLIFAVIFTLMFKIYTVDQWESKKLKELGEKMKNCC